MSFLGDALSPIISVAGSLFGQKQAQSYNSAASAQQNEWNKENYKNRYQWSTQDMRSAGLNPILAATNGIGGSVAGASAASVQAMNYGSSVSSAMSSDAQSNSASAAKQQAKVAENLSTSQIEKNIAERDLLENTNNGQVIRNGLAANELNLAEQTYEERLGFQRQKMLLELDNLRKTGSLLEAQQLSNLAAAVQSNSSSAYYDEYARSLRIDTDFVENIGGRYGANAVGGIIGQLLKNRK